MPVAQTDCRVVDENGNDVAPGRDRRVGDARAAVHAGLLEVAGCDRLRCCATDGIGRETSCGWMRQGQYYVVDRRKEMMKYKGFSIAPAEVESVLLEHPAVRDCGVVSRVGADGEETPCAFIVLRESELETRQSTDKVCWPSWASAWRATKCRARFILWPASREPHPARSCAGNCESCFSNSCSSVGTGGGD